MSGAVRFLMFPGIVAALSRLGTLFVAGAMTPEYSHLTNFNSELSAEDAPYQHAVTLSLYAYGTLLILFSIGLARMTRPSTVGFAGAVVLAAAGVGYILIGVYPCDPGCSLDAPSQTMRVHLLVGFGAMALQVFAMAIFGFYGRNPGEAAGIGTASKVLGAIAFISLLCLVGAFFGLADVLPDPVIAQKLLTLAGDMWLLIVAILLFRNFNKRR